MPHRMDVELTSRRDDGSWTWRAAGAREPKGVVPADLLYEGAGVGDVARVEALFEVDGITITSVLPPKEKKRPDAARLEVIGPPAETRPSPPAPRPAGDGGADRREPDGGRRPGRGGVRRDGEDRKARKPRERDDARNRRGAGERRGPGQQRGPGERRDGGDATPSGRPRRFSPAHVHRSAVLGELPPEQRPVAEQVLRGGIPAVRQAVEAQNADLRARRQPEVRAEPLVAMAEQLLPRLKAAEWRDRAEAAAKSVDEIPLRDLRSVVAGADAAARDDETRLLAGTLRQALERRQAEQRRRWTEEITAALDEDRLVRALRLSARPPDPGTRFPAELAVRLSEAAGQAMAADVPAERWWALLEAVADSPVRRSVKPVGLPADADESVLQTARQLSGRVPALAGLLGIDMPPPPGPARRRPRPLPSGRQGPAGPNLRQAPDRSSAP